MDKEPIVMIFMEPMGFEKIPTDAWDVFVPAKSKKWSRWGLLQKACWWFLNKTHCVHPHFDSKQLVRRVVIDREQATSRIVEMAEHQLRMFQHDRPKRILMGGEQFAKLAGEPIGMSPFHFNMELARSIPLPRGEDDRYRTDIEYFSIPVEVIPWMDGVLVL